MKQGWEIKKLGEVCTIGGGSTPSKTNKDYWENGAIPWFTIEDIREQGRKIRYTQKHITEKALNKTRLFPPKTTLLCCTASIGEYAISEVEITSNQQFNGIVVKDSGILNPYYIFYFAATLKEKLLKLSSKTTIDFVSTGKVKELTIPVPSLLEQGRIVGVLDAAFAKIDALKENAQKNLENAKALFQQVLKQELTPKPNWQTKKLSEVCETITDFVAAGSFAALRENVKYNSEKDFAQLVRTTDIKSNFTKGKFVYVSKSAFDFLYRVNLDKQSIVLPNVGVNCGEVYIVNPSQLPYEHNVLGPNAILVRSDTESNEFLSYAFKGQEFQKSLLGIINSMAQPKFNKTSLKKLLVCLPDKAEQNLIVKKLHSVEQMCSQIEANAEKTIAECDALKQAVLRRAFNGEL